MIRLKNVSKIYYNNGIIGTGFSKISLDLNIGEFIAITGESGSGKSTLLNVISGLDTYEEGEMYINGEETSHYSDVDFEEYRRKYIANIFQGFNLINSYTVRQNVELVLLIHGFGNKEVKQKVDDIIKKVGLWDYRNKRVSKLSGGQKQRVAIARALAKETPIIVADEPTGNLDSESSKQIIELLHEISKDKLVVIVTHNYEQVEKYVTRVIRMHDGKVIEDKKIKEVKYKDAKSSIHKKMSFQSKFRLAFRNTFNIFGKLLLILGVFFVCVIGILTDIGKRNKGEIDDLYDNIPYVFADTDLKRIIIRNKDKSKFTSEEYKKISNLNHVRKLVKNDIKIDSSADLRGDNEGLYLESTLYDIKDFDGRLIKGVMPKNEREAVLVTQEDDLTVKLFSNRIMNDTFSIRDVFDNSYPPTIKIVGIAYGDSNSDYHQIYTDINTIKKLETIGNVKYSNSVITLNKEKYKNILDDILILSDRVPKGSIYVSDILNSVCNNNNCTGEKIKVNVSNMYSENEAEFTIDKVIDKNNFKELANGYSYESAAGKIFMNLEDYGKLNDMDDYQSSIYVDDVKNVESVIDELDKLGLQYISIKKVANAEGTDFKKITDLLSLVGSVAIFFILYFVSYFIIYLVLKSRNTYFAIVRMLGGNINICRQLINIELFISVSISFIIVILLSLMFKYNIINYDILGGIMDYMEWYHYLISFGLLILLSQLVSRKFCKKIFKDSMITTYNMEV